MTVRAALPDLDTLNNASLKALVLAQHRTLAAQEEELHSKDEQLASHQAEIERLKLLISKLRRMQFGRRSEKLERQIEQLELQLDELEAAQAEKAIAAPTPGAAARTTDGGRPVRRPLPAHLPREVRKILPKEAECPDCGGRMRSIAAIHPPEATRPSWSVWACRRAPRPPRPPDPSPNPRNPHLPTCRPPRSSTAAGFPSPGCWVKVGVLIGRNMQLVSPLRRSPGSLLGPQSGATVGRKALRP